MHCTSHISAQARMSCDCSVVIIAVRAVCHAAAIDEMLLHARRSLSITLAAISTAGIDDRSKTVLFEV